MTSLEEIKKQLLEAEKEADVPRDQYHDLARKIVNIERQSFYGEDSERNRLKKIREEIDATVKRGGNSEV
ncbi:hypothetical protein [Thalassotalea mangrovi]|uniref:Uncharacterized protein n=1 Tax=Thalassotalea mangrovi TaxID=2572245 RepID=A0A4U1B8J1_9GAMM|nr:hypothetical protein [Thalassotalea mangrovi]TKB46335.1 hypothetical protein E8M12_04585 [Thalassotalea mangrovi]